MGEEKAESLNVERSSDQPGAACRLQQEGKDDPTKTTVTGTRGDASEPPRHTSTRMNLHVIDAVASFLLKCN